MPNRTGRLLDWLLDRPPWQTLAVGALATATLFAFSDPAQAATIFTSAIVAGIVAGIVAALSR